MTRIAGAQRVDPPGIARPGAATEDRRKRGIVVAVHCSGSSSLQWRRLAEACADRFELRAHDLYGCGRSAGWAGSGEFTLADEALPVIAAIDEADRPVHLVGHSYGGAVALHAALRRAGRVASLSLYEPTAFHLLPRLGAEGEAAHAEIKAVAGAVADGVICGDYRGAAGRFVDYWSGEGSWEQMAPETQAEIARWIVKAPLDFHALFRDPAPLIAYAGLRCPVLLLRGEHAPAPTRLVTVLLGDIIPFARVAVIRDAGHMGAITHAADVNPRIVAHIEHAQSHHPTWRAAC